MTSNTLSEKLQKKLPNKKIFIIIIFLLTSLTIGTMVALANENAVIVESSVLNVRYGPGLSHDVLTQVEKNDRLFVLGEENKWYKVILQDDKVGWVASWLVGSNNVLEEDKQFVRVNTTAVNIRQYANTESDILGVVYEDTELQVLYKDGPWYQILYMGQVAWIHGDYTESIENIKEKEISSEEQTTPSSDTFVKMGEVETNIRSLPSVDGEIIYRAEANEVFDYIKTVDNWHQIQINSNQTGYVASWVSSIEKSSNVAAPTPDSTESAEAQYARKVSSLAEATIVIDAGHGGKDPGAISSDNTIFEKDTALSTALLLRDRLQDAGTNVVLTRDKDIAVSLDSRIMISHQHNADAFISLHYDAVEKANTMSGTTTYYQKEGNLELANTINQYLSQNGPLPNNGVRSADYKVLRNNNQPAILLELGYMNHFMDTQHINTLSYQSAVVEAIYQGLREYYGK